MLLKSRANAEYGGIVETSEMQRDWVLKDMLLQR